MRSYAVNTNKDIPEIFYFLFSGAKTLIKILLHHARCANITPGLNQPVIEQTFQNKSFLIHNKYPQNFKQFAGLRGALFNSSGVSQDVLADVVFQTLCC